MVICSGAVLLIFALFVEFGGFGLVYPFDMFTVVPLLQCPNAPETVVTSSPAEIKAEAAKCRNAMKIHH